jgi:hypothetical protein
LQLIDDKKDTGSNGGFQFSEHLIVPFAHPSLVAMSIASCGCTLYRRLPSMTRSPDASANWSLTDSTL